MGLEDSESYIIPHAWRLISPAPSGRGRGPLMRSAFDGRVKDGEWFKIFVFVHVLALGPQSLYHEPQACEHMPEAQPLGFLFLYVLYLD